MPDQQIPARYVGAHSVILSAFQGPFRDANGTPLDSLLITRGSTLLLGAREVLGASYKFDVTGQSDPLDLGVGRVVLPADAGLSAAELTAVGYEFHEGRADFEPLTVPAGITPIRPTVVEADAAPVTPAEAAPPSPAASDEGTAPSSAAGADEDVHADADAPETPATEPNPTEAPASPAADDSSPEPEAGPETIAEPEPPSIPDEVPAEAPSATADAVPIAESETSSPQLAE